MKARAQLRIWCEEWGHAAVHSPVWFATLCNVPFDATPYDLAQRLHCSKCGSHRVGVLSAPDETP
jgi:hypothetical protein